MVRGSVNGFGQGLHLDVTTTGSLCISSLPSARQGGRGVLRLHDVTTPCPKCGKAGVIVGNLMPHMKYHGLPAAVHGAQIHCGCPPGTNKLIAPLERPQGARAASAAQVDNAPTADTPSVNPASADKTAALLAGSNEKTSAVVCNHPDQMEELARYIADEMNRNISHPSVLKMKELNSYDPEVEAKKVSFYLRFGHQPNYHSIALAKHAEAFVLWAERVGQNRPWDHKPKLRKIFPGVRHKQGNYDYFYDIWSNIHYGYVGSIGGLSESVLLDGAGVEQIASDTIRKIDEVATKPKEHWRLPGPHPTASAWTELRSWDDVADRVAISIGIKLSNEYLDGGLTAKIVMDEVLAIDPGNWGEGVSVHVCE